MGAISLQERQQSIDNIDSDDRRLEVVPEESGSSAAGKVNLAQDPSAVNQARNIGAKRGQIADASENKTIGVIFDQQCFPCGLDADLLFATSGHASVPPMPQFRVTGGHAHEKYPIFLIDRALRVFGHRRCHA